MTHIEGIRTASDRELDEALHTLCEQMKQDSVFSPLWKASTYWLNRTYAEIRRRQQDDWGNAFSFGDPGDEIEN
jgi:hypothetical protein